MMRVGLALALLASVGWAENLLANGSFDEKLKGWQVRADGSYWRVEMSRAALRVTKKRGAPDSYAIAFPLPQRTRGGHFRVSADVKGVKVAGAEVRFQLLDAAGAALLEVSDLRDRPLRGSFDWNRLTRDFRRHERAVRGRVELIVDGARKFWLDDVEVVWVATARRVNLLRNGGFELDRGRGAPLDAPGMRADHGHVAGWHSNMGWYSGVRYRIDDEVKAEGDHSLLAVKRGGTVGASFANCEFFHLPRRGRVRVSARIRGEDVEYAGLTFLMYGRRGVTLFHRSLEGGADLSGLTTLLRMERYRRGTLKGTFEWKEIERVFDLPPEAVRGRILLNWQVHGQGRVWLDDVSVFWEPPEAR
ncbi:MAG: hypothetical protein ACYS0K_14700 [Planctomycetota bacterium]|jgi:hypothetical protein